MRNVLNQPSWRIASDKIEAFVTKTGGHLGPVTFDRTGRQLQPYSVAPWAREILPRSTPPVIRALRGDFFCLPFGGNAKTFRGERHPVHGETANARWRFESRRRVSGKTTLHLSLKSKIRPGRIDKKITLLDEQNVLYCEHLISEMRGPMNFGHHAMLRFPDSPESGVISTSPFAYGQVFPDPFEKPENQGYQSLKPGAEFKSLHAVPLLKGGTTDLARYPARRGFEDLVMICSRGDQAFAWTAVTFARERYVWFALKNPNVLRQTVFWISNGGRYYPPWNGRHVNVMGIEDVTSYFHYGLAESAQSNPMSQKGIPTCIELSLKAPLRVAYIMGVAPIQRGFDRVVSIEPAAGKSAIGIRSANGQNRTVAIDLGFLSL